MKRLTLTLCLLCLAPVTKHEAQRLLEQVTPHPKRVRKAIPLPVLVPAVSRPVTRAVVVPPPSRNVAVTWTCSTNWLSGEDTRAGLDVRHILTGYVGLSMTGRQQIVTSLIVSTNLRTWQPLTNMAYAQSNRVTLPASKPSQLFRAFVGPAKQ